MTKESNDYLKMAFRSIECFSNDGKLDPQELDKIVRIAKQDGEVDENEKRVLRNIFSRLNKDELSSEMVDKIEEIRSKYDI